MQLTTLFLIALMKGRFQDENFDLKVFQSKACRDAKKTTFKFDIAKSEALFLYSWPSFIIHVKRCYDISCMDI